MTSDEALRQLLNRAIRASGKSQREVERELGMGQGYLSSVFKGRIQLKVALVYGIARILNVDPLSFFAQVTPPRDPSWLLKQLGIQALSEPTPSPLPSAGASLEEIQNIVKKMVQDEIARLEDDYEAGKA